KDSRPTDDNAAIRRRRYCPSCGSRFTTFERVQLRELTVVKKNGQRVQFDRDKLARSITVACRKRPVDPERIERVVNGIVRRLESSDLRRGNLALAGAFQPPHDAVDHALDALGIDGALAAGHRD